MEENQTIQSKSFHCGFGKASSKAVSPPPHAGLQCETKENECAPKHDSAPPRCLNGGQCVDGVSHYSCNCLPGFAGQHCEGDVNECLSRPCHSPGTLDCVQLTNDYKCSCRLGYTGRERTHLASCFC